MGQISAVPARSLVGPSNDFVAVKLWQYYIPVVFFIQDFTDKMILFRFTTFTNISQDLFSQKEDQTELSL